MKPNENYSVMIRRLERAGLKQVVRKAGAGREAANKPTGAATNTATAMGLSTERPTFDAQRVADIKLQFAFGNYQIDTARLAAKLLDTDVLCSNSKWSSQYFEIPNGESIRMGWTQPLCELIGEQSSKDGRLEVTVFGTGAMNQFRSRCYLELTS